MENPSARKAARMNDIELLLLAHPQGLAPGEIAERLGVDKSTVSRYQPDLPKHIYVDDLDGGKWKVDKQAYLINVRFNLHEALAIHLAARLLTTRIDRQNPHAASALRKLGNALERLAPHISRHMLQSAEVMETGQRKDLDYLHVLEGLSLAWAEGRKLRVWHRAEADGKLIAYIFSPYFIEPYAVGQSTHVIGFREPPGKVRTFKVERIERVEPLGEHYEIPADFDPSSLLADAWGIWYTEAEPVQVVLKFGRGAAGRVKESRWHRSEEVEEQEDGSLIWRAKIAEPRELLPWIRGWGAEVEVLEPANLREPLRMEQRLAAENYGWIVNEPGGSISAVDELNPRADNKMKYYAHTRGSNKAYWQTIIEHLTSTAEIAHGLCEDAGVAQFAYVAALLHDIGKYSLAFQRRLEGATEKIDHSTAGAQEILKMFSANPVQRIYAEILAFCITGHHGGLLDYGSTIDLEVDGTLQARLKKQVEDYQAYATEIDLARLMIPDHLPIRLSREMQGFTLSFFTRMIFSTLVDADFLETETFMNGGRKPRGEYEDISTLAHRFEEFLHRFEHPEGAINKRRTETLKNCIARAGDPKGMFTLTLPTGGGKTFASMAFAFQHAVHHGLRRIIYVIPYTSIIEQNAAEFKRCLGENTVLEHHSNFDWNPARRVPSRPETDDSNDEDAQYKLRLAAENWDIPIIVTTSVQFFESLFSNRSSRCRKIHNLSKNVIIFDEAQMLPRSFLKPCLYAASELVRNYGASVVFCTATQPCIDRFLPDGSILKELIPNPQEQFDFYKRVQVKNIGKCKDADLLAQINQHNQVLCIVNTRKHARALFAGLEGYGRFHLSTLMCPAHRRIVITTIRDYLKKGLSCRVISTQLLEAGVDLDFPVGFRALAGLESIIQSAGRVNREGKSLSADLFVFEPDSEYARRMPAYIRQAADVARLILDRFDDPVCVQAIQAYYAEIYDLQHPSAFDSQNILACFEKRVNPPAPAFDFQTAAERFRLIDNDTVTVIIPWGDEARRQVEKLRTTEFPLPVSRALQLYTVNIFEPEYQALLDAGAITIYCDRFAVLNNPALYDDQVGLVIPDTAGGQAIFLDQ